MPRQPHHRRLSDLLNQSTAIRKSRLLSGLLARATSSDQISARLDECLPGPLKGKFQVGKLENCCLTLLCSSAALATRFRFEQEKILIALQMRLGESQVREIRLQIRPGLVKEAQNQQIRRKESIKSVRTSPEERLGELLERLERRSS